MGRLNADHYIFVIARTGSRPLDIHVIGILFVADIRHTDAANINQRKEARLHAINYAVAEVFKVAPAGTARIDHRRQEKPSGNMLLSPAQASR